MKANKYMVYCLSAMLAFSSMPTMNIAAEEIVLSEDAIFTSEENVEDVVVFEDTTAADTEEVTPEIITEDTVTEDTDAPDMGIVDMEAVDAVDVFSAPEAFGDGTGTEEIQVVSDTGAVSTDGWVALTVEGYENISYKYDAATKTWEFKSSVADAAMPDGRWNKIGGDAWTDIVKEVETVVIGENIVKVGSYNFCNDNGSFPNLKTVTLGDAVTTIGDYAFMSVATLTSANISKVTKFGQDSFYKTGLTSVTLEADTVELDKRAFGYCTSLTQASVKTVKNIPSMLFTGCSALTTFTASNVETIGSSAFSNCKSLTQLNLINENISSIGTMAFSGTKIGTLTLSNAEVTLGMNVFRNCEITGICYAGTKEQWTKQAGSARVPATAVVHYKGDAAITEDEREAACETAGIEKKTCSVCGTEFKVETAALGHKYGLYTVVKEATCEETGIEVRSCTREGCGAIEKVSIPKLGHDYYDVYVEVKAATCEEAGSEAHYCSREGCDAFEEREIPALGHEYGEEYVEVKAATCEEAGSEARYCTREGCKGFEEREIPALGHEYGEEYVEVKAATCEEAGSEARYCTREGCKGFEEREIPALGHEYTEKVTKEATCVSEGEKSSVCTKCGDVEKTEVIAATGVHTWSSWKTVSSATVFKAKEQERTCSVCGEKVTRTKGNPLTAKATVSASTVTLKVHQYTSKFKVTGMAKGDSVKTWKSTNTKVFSVIGRSDGTSVLIAKKKGTAKLEITLKSGLKKTVTVKVQEDNVKTTSITGLDTKMTLTKGSTATLNPVRKPFTSQQKITYTSSAPKVVSVTDKGVLTAKGAGTAKITVKSGSKSVVVTVTVPKVKTTAISTSSSVSVKKGKTTTLKVTVTPANSDQKVTYVSSNEKVATVDANGKIKGIKKGTATITVKSGSKQTTVKVTVK